MKSSATWLQLIGVVISMAGILLKIMRWPMGNEVFFGGILLLLASYILRFLFWVQNWHEITWQNAVLTLSKEFSAIFLVLTILIRFFRIRLLPYSVSLWLGIGFGIIYFLVATFLRFEQGRQKEEDLIDQIGEKD